MTLKELGYLQVGMVLVDGKGNEGTVTDLYTVGNQLWVEVNKDPNPIIWDWSKVKKDVLVKDGTYKPVQLEGEE